MNIIISLILAYLIGSISCAILASKIGKTADPRTSGSKNAGATNILRTMGMSAAIYVLLGDALKGLIAVLIARLLRVSGFPLALVVLAVVLGHIFPLYFKFKGGKGVATMLGALLVLSWAGLLAILTWGVVAAITRYSSVAAIAAMVTAPFYCLIGSHVEYFVPILLTSALVIWKHWPNIERLRNKTEPKLKIPKIPTWGKPKHK